MIRNAFRFALFLLALPLAAQAWIHDADRNKIDDRIERVHQEGFAFAFENADPARRMVIGVFEGAPLRYGIYVGFDRRPTPDDVATLQSFSKIPVKPYEYIDYIRAEATHDQIVAIAHLPGVTRVEAVPMIYPRNHWGSRVVRARDSRGLQASENWALFPSARNELGLDGTGIVIGVLDTGVNDEADEVSPTYPGHESLLGKFLGGGEFYFGDPLLNTGLDESSNPQDHGSLASSYHATHVAGTAMGTGGQDGFFAGVAPAARLVDCKVLSDAGAGFGSADGVEWCIHNKDNDWGLTGADTVYSGIDVLNLSLGGLDASDGTDAGSQMINAAVAAGLVVCIATGNDGNVDYIASPAAADDCIAVGASDHYGTLDRTDDTVTDFSNEGVRDDDGDSDHVDEMKPSVVAPGAGILSANGDPTTDGGAYHGLSGTSMATPHTAGVAALVRQANPSLTPLEVRSILQNTAIHGIPSVKGNRPGDPYGLDPNYNPEDGWGLVDVYAAAKEAMNSTGGVQVVRLRAVPRPDDLEIDVHWWTQREYSFQGFNVWRAPDANDAPGTFVQINGVLVAPTGDPDLDGDDNREQYTYVDDDPALQLGERYWYRVDWVDSGGTPHPEPPFPATLGELPRVATLFYSIVHNTPDNDLFVRLGTSAARNPDNAQFFVIGPGSAGADSTVVIEPVNEVTTTLGNQERFWSIGLTTADGVYPPTILPPSFIHPWFLNVTEGGYVNRTGRLTSFSLFQNDSPGSETGTLYVSDTPTPVYNVETQQSTMWIPEGTPAAAGIASIGAESVEGGIRVSLQLAPGSSVARVTVFRGESDRFEERAPVPDGDLAVGGLEVEYLDRAVQADRRYWYWVELRDENGSTVMGGPVSARSSALDLGRTVALPASPNPLGPGGTMIRYTLGADVAGTGTAPVTLSVFDVRGRLLRKLKEATESEGEYEVHWDGRDASGRRVVPGVYYTRFRAGPLVRTSKINVVR